jgi:anaerobic selenocysteine-containing dehydrogenase
MAQGGRVVVLTPYSTGTGQKADLALPAAAPLEAHDEAPSPEEGAVATWAVSRPLFPNPPWSFDPVELLGKLASRSGVSLWGQAEKTPATVKQLVANRAKALHRLGRGAVITPAGESTELTDLESAAALEQLLQDGAVWADDPHEAQPPTRVSLFGDLADPLQRLRLIGEKGRRAAVTDKNDSYPVTLIPGGLLGAAGDGALPPVMAKLYRESLLRQAGQEALVNPETGMKLGLADKGTARFDTPQGTIQITVFFDDAVLPGVLHVASGPGDSAFGDDRASPQNDVGRLCRADSSGSWRLLPAKTREG